MADTKLSVLTAGAAPADADLFYTSQSATSLSVTAQQMRAYVLGSPVSNAFDVVLGKLLFGSSSGTIAFIGDSTTAGTQAGQPTANTNVRANSFPSQFKNILLQAGIPATDDSLFGTANILPDANYDSRLTIGAGWAGTTVNGSRSVGGPIWDNTTTTNPLTFVPTQPTDTIDVWYIKEAGDTTFTISDGNGHTTTSSASGSAAVTKITLHTGVTLGQNTYTITKTSGSGHTYIIGWDAYDSTTPKVRIWNMGFAGATSTMWADTSQTYACQSALVTIAPNACVVNIGINDWVNAVSLSTFATNMTSILTAAQGVCPVTAMVPNATGVATTTLATQITYWNKIKAAAVALSIPWIDLPARLGTAETQNTNGMMSSDLVHPYGTGYINIARAIALSSSLFGNVTSRIYDLGILTADAKALTVKANWNASGVTFSAPVTVNITKTAAASGSKLLDYQLSGTSKIIGYAVGQGSGSGLELRVGDKASQDTIAIDTGYPAVVWYHSNALDSYINQSTNFNMNTASRPIGLAPGGNTALLAQSNGTVVLGTGSVATNATDGFTYIATCAGTPTGTPTAQTGRVPMVFDTSGTKFWIYTGGAWKGVVVA